MKNEPFSVTKKFNGKTPYWSVLNDRNEAFPFKTKKDANRVATALKNIDEYGKIRRRLEVLKDEMNKLENAEDVGSRSNELAYIKVTDEFDKLIS